MEIKELQRKQTKWTEHAERLHDQMAEKQKIVTHLAIILEEEKEDVEQLKSFSLANIFSTIAGNKQEKLMKREKEVIEAKLKYQEAYKVLHEMEDEKQGYLQKINQLGDVDAQYKAILDRKEQLIHDKESIWSEELFKLTEAEAEIVGGLQEYQEAIEAGTIARQALDEAVQSFDKAKNWSTFDLFGGGLITTAIKHSHLDDAKKTVHDAEKRLRQFQDELFDIENHMKVDLDISELLTFADYFFDGIVVDWMVHNKIHQAMSQIEETFELVKITLQTLEQEQITLKEKLDTLSLDRIKLIEQA